jgi:hypothetical protein
MVFGDCNQLAKIDLFNWNSSTTLVGNNFLYIAPTSMKMQTFDFFLNLGKSRRSIINFFLFLLYLIGKLLTHQ